MTIHRLTEAVAKRLTEGWKWEVITPDSVCLMPPKGDKRRGWDLDWVAFDTTGRIGKVVPQWVDSEYEELHKNDI